MLVDQRESKLHHLTHCEKQTHVTYQFPLLSSVAIWNRNKYNTSTDQFILSLVLVETFLCKVRETRYFCTLLYAALSSD